MYRYIYISVSDLSKEEIAKLMACISSGINRETVEADNLADNLKGYFLYSKLRDSHFYVRAGGLHTELDDHLRVNSYQQYMQHVFESLLEK